MSIRLLLLTLAFLVLKTPIVAQGLEGFDAAANMSGSTGHMFRSFDNRYEGVRGYPTIFEEFVLGNVMLKGGNVAKNEVLNFDAMTNELLVKTKKVGKLIMVVRSDMVEGFTLMDDEGNEMNFVKLKTEPGTYFFHRLYEGKCALYKKHAKTVEKANYGGAYNNNSRKYDEFIWVNKYYIREEGAETGALKEIKINKREIEKLFPGKSEILKDYYKSRKPDLKKDTDLASLFKFIDEA